MEATKILAGSGPTALEFEGEKLEAPELEVMIVLRLSKLMGFITLHFSALSNQICDTQHVAIQSSKGIMTVSRIKLSKKNSNGLRDPNFYDSFFLLPSVRSIAGEASEAKSRQAVQSGSGDDMACGLCHKSAPTAHNGTSVFQVMLCDWSETHTCDYSDIVWSLESSLLDGPKRRVASGLVGGAKTNKFGQRWIEVFLI